MFSSYHGDTSEQASSGCEEPKEEIEAPAAQASGAGGAGDGSWVKSGRSWSEELDESYGDPWLEPNKRPDLPCETTTICDTGCEKLFVPKKCNCSDQESKHIPVKTSMEVTVKSPKTPDLIEADREGDLEVCDSQEKEKKMKQMHMASMVPRMHQPMPNQRVPVPFMAAGIPRLSSPVYPPAGEIPPQCEMMYMACMVPGMRLPMPIQRAPVPFMAAGNPHLGSPVCPPAGEIPPQYEMMHMAGMVPGMRLPMPIQWAPVPFMAAGNPHLASPVCTPAGEIPPQYEMMYMVGMVPGMRLPMPNQRVPVPFMAARIPCLTLPVSPHAGTIYPQYEVNEIPAVAVSAESVSQHSSSSNAVGGASWVTKKKKGRSRRTKGMWMSPVNVLN